MAVDYTKYRTLNYFQYEPPAEYRREYLADEFNKISHVLDQHAQEFYPAKGATTITATYAATVLDDVLLCTGTFTLTLYDAIGKVDNLGIKQNAGRRITIKNIGTGIITIDGAGSQTIDGSTTTPIADQYALLTLCSDGANWHIIAETVSAYKVLGKALVMGF